MYNYNSHGYREAQRGRDRETRRRSGGHHAPPPEHSQRQHDSYPASTHAQGYGVRVELGADPDSHQTRRAPSGSFQSAVPNPHLASRLSDEDLAGHIRRQESNASVMEWMDGRNSGQPRPPHPPGHQHHSEHRNESGNTGQSRQPSGTPAYESHPEHHAYGTTRPGYHPPQMPTHEPYREYRNPSNAHGQHPPYAHGTPSAQSHNYHNPSHPPKYPRPRSREYLQWFCLNKRFTNFHANTATPPPSTAKPKVPDSEFDYVVDLCRGTMVENKKR